LQIIDFDHLFVAAYEKATILNELNAVDGETILISDLILHSPCISDIVYSYDPICASYSELESAGIAFGANFCDFASLVKNVDVHLLALAIIPVFNIARFSPTHQYIQLLIIVEGVGKLALRFKTLQKLSLF